MSLDVDMMVSGNMEKSWSSSYSLTCHPAWLWTPQSLHWSAAHKILCDDPPIACGLQKRIVVNFWDLFPPDFIILLNHSHPIRQFHIWPVAWPHCPWQIAGLSLWHGKGAAMPGLRPVLSLVFMASCSWVAERQLAPPRHVEKRCRTMKKIVCLQKSRNRHQKHRSFLCYGKWYIIYST